MLERLSVRFCKSFVYIFLMKFIFATKIALNDSISLNVLYLIIALLMSLFLEAFHYFIVDLIKYSQLILLVIVALSGLLLYHCFSYYYLTIIIYMDYVIIKELLESYTLYKSLKQFQTNKD